ncbi:MAG: hypothetical protein P4M14_08705 [Gammaproteobacteria bacterium]|nr:hypothetical protein [Gammaproteobacteria bacterium]
MSQARMNNNPFKAIEKPLSIHTKEVESHKTAPVFSAHELENLYALPQSQIYDNDELEFDDEKYQHKKLKMFRHMLTTAGVMRFGREGKPVSNHIPPHYLMGDCLTAGNTLVNPQNEIVKFNNKSGNFKPDANTLQYIVMALRLITLKHSGIKIADHIEIEFMYYHSVTRDFRITYSREAFCELADELIKQYKAKPSFVDADGKFLFDFDGPQLNVAAKPELATLPSAAEPDDSNTMIDSHEQEATPLLFSPRKKTAKHDSSFFAQQSSFRSRRLSSFVDKMQGHGLNLLAAASSSSPELPAAAATTSSAAISQQLLPAASIQATPDPLFSFNNANRKSSASKNLFASFSKPTIPASANSAINQDHSSLSNEGSPNKKMRV